MSTGNVTLTLSTTEEAQIRALVTGATNGIGEQIALRLAEAGMAVVLVGRDWERLDAARERIARAVPGAELWLERADLAELPEVRALAARMLVAPLPEVVISNAAMVTPLDRFNSEGLPRVLAVNHLAPYLLIRTLAPALIRGRIIVVGADPVLLARAPVDLNDLCISRPERRGKRDELRPFRAYGETKNMNTMLVYELARRLSSTHVTVNGAHPGIVPGTGLGREVPGIGELARSALKIEPGDLSTPATAADTPVWLATSPKLEGVTGQFFVGRQAVATADHTTDRERCRRLWEESARLVGLPA
jgi:NAD(P)-dependent dehydrogenase (short-subunit alcohol dehydrogenase family)